MVGRTVLVALALTTVSQLLSSSVNAAPTDSQSCRHHYQEALTEALKIREQCDSAAFQDCCQAGKVSFQSGIHEIGDVCEDSYEPFAISKMYARCDVSSDGGGWTVILRRVAGGTVDFNRVWEDYEDGFGDLRGEFWYGLENIYCLTTREDMELRIDLRKTKFNGEGVTWVYKTFSVNGSDDNYRLLIGEGEGPGVDAMAVHNNQQFSTRDEDNDAFSRNCASIRLAGWWYNACDTAVLTGPHVTPAGAHSYAKLRWYGKYYPNVEMKVRPKSCLTG